MSHGASARARGPREASPSYDPSSHLAAAVSAAAPFEERALVALWLLGRVPPSALPLPLLRPGRAGRGPGPDVREATVLLPSGVTRTGDVEMHLRATDFVHHGHAEDPAYARVILHVVWQDDRPPGWRGGERGTPTPHLGGSAPVMEIAPSLRGDPRRLEALVARGPSGSGAEPCADLVARVGSAEAAGFVRIEGQRRLAERAWRAGALVARYGWSGAWAQLLDRAVRATAGRRHETAAQHEAHLAAIGALLGDDPLGALIACARDGRPAALIEGVRAPGFGAGRAAEVAWNAALPLLMAAATQYADLDLARATAQLAAAWPTPAPYGKTTALAHLAGPAPHRSGALYAQGLLHLQDLWCTRGGCGTCPLSPPLEG